jgi:hypothetical protein
MLLLLASVSESKSPSIFPHWVEGVLLGKLVIKVDQHAIDGVYASVLNELLHTADAVLLACDFLADSDDVEGSRLRSFHLVVNSCSCGYEDWASLPDVR